MRPRGGRRAGAARATYSWNAAYASPSGPSPIAIPSGPSSPTTPPQSVLSRSSDEAARGEAEVGGEHRSGLAHEDRQRFVGERLARRRTRAVGSNHWLLADAGGEPLAVDEQHVAAGVARQAAVQLAHQRDAALGQPQREMAERRLVGHDERVLDDPRAVRRRGAHPTASASAVTVASSSSSASSASSGNPRSAVVGAISTCVGLETPPARSSSPSTSCSSWPYGASVQLGVDPEREARDPQMLGELRGLVGAEHRETDLLASWREPSRRRARRATRCARRSIPRCSRRRAARDAAAAMPPRSGRRRRAPGPEPARRLLEHFPSSVRCFAAGGLIRPRLTEDNGEALASKPWANFRTDGERHAHGHGSPDRDAAIASIWSEVLGLDAVGAGGGLLRARRRLAARRADARGGRGEHVGAGRASSTSSNEPTVEGARNAVSRERPRQDRRPGLQSLSRPSAPETTVPA